MRLLTSQPSIRRRLLGWLITPILLSGLLVGVLAYFVSWHEIEEVYDAQLVHFARALEQLSEHTAPNQGIANHNDEKVWHKYELNITYRTWENDKLVASSGQAELLSGLTFPPGFSDAQINGKKWRIFVLVDGNGNRRFETAERYAIRYEVIEGLMVSLLVPILIFILLALLAVFFGVYYNLKPLKHLAEVLAKRDEQDLSSLEIPENLQELTPMIVALNKLLKRVDTSLQQEREFAEHAAHELRTPLAALKTQVQVLVRQKAIKPDAKEGVANLQQTIARAEHLVEQLLSLAHLHGDAPRLTAVDVSKEVKDCLAELSPLARSKKITLTLNLQKTLPWQAQPEAVNILVRNLLDNAMKYTPEGGKVTVNLLPEGELQIIDTGPGLTASQKKQVFGRFVRFDRSGQTGAGVGLAIVQRVVTLFGAHIKLDDNTPHGLKVKVWWHH